MPRLGPQKSRVLMRILRENGLVECRPSGKSQGKGSHCVMEHPTDPGKTTVIPSYSEIDTGLAATIIRQSGKTISEYLSHL